MGRERIVCSLEGTLSFGREIGANLSSNSILALRGPLGAGKTALVQGIAQGLGIVTSIQSPTFVFLNVYEGRLPLFHFDLYRMQTADDFMGLGFYEYFDQGGICAIEWPDLILPLLPEHTLWISLAHDPQGRRFTIIRGSAS